MIEPIISLYKADISQHKAAIRELSGEQKKAAEQHLSLLEKQNSAIEGHIKTLGQVAVVAGAVAIAGKALWEGWEHNIRKAQLATNVVSSDVARLQEGFGGLRTEMEALEAANRLSNGAFKLTGDQMETVGKAIRELVREGHSWEESTKKVTDAIVKLEGDSLKDFGIQVRSATTDGEKFTAIMEAMSAKAGKLRDTTKTSAEEMVSLKTRYSEVMDRVKAGLGEVALAFLPVVDSLAKVAGYVASIVGAIPGGAGTVGKVAKYSIPIYGQVLFAYDAATGQVVDKGTLKKLGAGDQDAIDAAMRASMRGLDLEVESVTPVRKGPAAKPTMPGYTIGDGYASSGSTSLGAPAGYSDMWTSSIGSASLGAYSDITSGMLNTAAWNSELAGQQAMETKQRSLLERTFGPIEEFDIYRGAFEMLQSTASGAFSAWVDGSMSAGEAFKKFIGESLKATASYFFGESIKFGLLALVSLIPGPTFNPDGALKYGAAAAEYAAGALLVGGMARGLGAGGSSPSGSRGSSGAAPTRGLGGESSGVGNTYVVTYGDSMADDSPYWRQRNARRLIDTVMGSPGVK